MRHSTIWALTAAVALAGASMLGATPAEARGVTIYATTAPPPPRQERIPHARRGCVWTPGYWNWSHRKYVWHGGQYVRERRGYHYSPARWNRDGDRWRYYGGRWDH